MSCFCEHFLLLICCRELENSSIMFVAGVDELVTGWLLCCAQYSGVIP